MFDIDLETPSRNIMTIHVSIKSIWSIDRNKIRFWTSRLVENDIFSFQCIIRQSFFLNAFSKFFFFFDPQTLSHRIYLTRWKNGKMFFSLKMLLICLIGFKFVANHFPDLGLSFPTGHYAQNELCKLFGKSNSRQKCDFC